MKATLIRIAVGMMVAGVSGAIDGALMTLAAPEAVFEHWKSFLAVTIALGLKAAFLYFKQHEKELTDVIDPRRLGTLLLVATCLGGAACVSSAPPPQIAPGAPSAAPTELRRAVDWASTAVEVARTMQKVEIEAYRAGRVTDAAHRITQTAFREFFGAAVDALTIAQDVTKSEVTRWASAKAIGALAAAMLDRVDDHLPLIVKGYVDSLRAVLGLLNGNMANAG
jgi:hypothetical protein